MLTKEEFLKIPSGKIFEFKPGRNDIRTFMFVAKKGQVDDWAIYTSLNAIPGVHFWAGDKQGLANHGEKVRDLNLINKLVPCTAEVLKMYRF